MCTTGECPQTLRLMCLMKMRATSSCRAQGSVCPSPSSGLLAHGQRVRGGVGGQAQQRVVVADLSDGEHLPSLPGVNILIVFLVSNPKAADLSQR